MLLLIAWFSFCVSTAALKAIDAAGCDSITKRRVREVHEVPGALWQIYDAHDADKIRDFLNKVRRHQVLIAANSRHFSPRSVLISPQSSASCFLSRSSNVEFR